MAGWGQEQQPAPKAPAIHGEVAWERLRDRLDNAIGFWVGFAFAPVPADMRVLRERVERHVASEKRMMASLIPGSPNELRDLPMRLIEDRSLGNAALIWIEALHAEAPGAPEMPWTRAWEETAVQLEELFGELRGVLLGGVVLAAPPVLVDPISKAAPDLWEVKAMSFMIAPRNANTSTASLRAVPPRTTRPSTNSVRAVDPDDLVAISQDAARLKVWEKANPSTLGMPAVSQRVDVTRARALVDAAEGFLQQGRMQDAKDAADEAATLLRVRGDPMDEARVFAVLAEIEAEYEDYARAAVHIQKAISAVGSRAPDKVPPAWYCLAGRVARERREHGAAMRFEELALASIRAMRQGDETPGALVELSDALERIGDARLGANKPADAVVAFSECLLIRRRVLAARGEQPEPLGEVSYSLKRLAAACVHANDVVSAVAAYREAVTIDRKLYAMNEQDAEVRYQLADSLWRLGDALTTSGEPKEGAAMSEEATSLLSGGPPASTSPSRIVGPATRRNQQAMRRR